jgi:hypothetical protein
MYAYPKTPRLTDLIRSDTDPWKQKGLIAIVEEKVDGANAGISFEDGHLILQSRGHILSGGPREAQFDFLKRWANDIDADLYQRLGERYVAYGEWCYAKNRIFYDDLPSYFIEFDLFDKTTGNFLSTPQRSCVLTGGPLTSVVVLQKKRFDRTHNFAQLIGKSNYKTPDWKSYFDIAMAGELGRHYANAETEDSVLMEGIYIKIEDDEKVVGRAKLPRPEFEKVKTDDSKWLRRPIFPNKLRSATNRSPR